MKDTLGDRMKGDYEDRARIMLPRRSYTMIRIDGRSFHTYTKGLTRPFDDALIDDMDATAKYLCENIAGAKFAFIQSDEISILLTDFESENTEAWYDNNLQKICSVSASMATAKFNELRLKRILDNASRFVADVAYKIIKEGFKKNTLAHFDSRVWQIPSRVEVYNYFLWRQQDTTRNSISSVAQSMYKHKELEGQNTKKMQELIFKKGTNWNDFAPKYKRGRMVSKEWEKRILGDLSEKNKKKMEQVIKSSENYFVNHAKNEFGVRTKVWKVIEVPIFSQDKEFLCHRIPHNNENITTINY